MEMTLKKTVSRTYSLRDGGFYKCQFELEQKFEKQEAENLNVALQYEAMGKVLDCELKAEKEKLGL